MAFARFDAVALDCPDPQGLAAFYQQIVGGEVTNPHEGWVELRPGDGPAIAFQVAPNHRPPTWPGDEHQQQLHLDFAVEDLDIAEPLVLAAGARKADFQPYPNDFRVYLDPAGHPFCLVLPFHP